MTSVAFAPPAVVSTSIKAEVLAATHVARSLRGRCWLFDPGGGAPPAGVIGLRWNPLCDFIDWDAPRSVATRLAGPARGGAGAGHDGDRWVDRAETWLAVLLFAARLSQPGGDIAALARWCM
jgi:type IV secretion system protein VirD4